MTADLSRYSRQMLFTGIGQEGQARLADSRVLLCGCGALGTVIAETLVRAGVGFVRIVDRDFVDLSNLQRQTLFDEQDVSERLPKSVAAANKLATINSQVRIEPIIADINPANVLQFFDGVDLVIDGTDNFEVRYLINDASLETGTPWIYGGCIGSHGQTMAIFPGETACLRCLIEKPPEASMTETCDTAGVIAPAVNVVASLECVAALKILSGHRADVRPELIVVDVWDTSLRSMDLSQLRDQGRCPACIGGERAWLSGDQGARSTILCGRNSVQVSPGEPATLDLDVLAGKLASAGRIVQNRFLLRLIPHDADIELTIFRDGRAIIQGTDEIARARSLYARYIGL